MLLKSNDINIVDKFFHLRFVGYDMKDLDIWQQHFFALIHLLINDVSCKSLTTDFAFEINQNLC